MLSPWTRRANSFVARCTSERSTEIIPSMFSSARMGDPAATRPIKGTATVEGGGAPFLVLAVPTSSKPLHLFGFLRTQPFRARAFTCSWTALGDLKENSCWISKIVGGKPDCSIWVLMNSKTSSWRFVNLTTFVEVGKGALHACHLVYCNFVQVSSKKSNSPRG